MNANPRQTPLHAAHLQLRAKMVDFAGWDMPVQYSSLIQEHEAVRTRVGLFDVSHMGEIEFRGPGALESANALISNDLSRAADGQALYAGLLNDRGGFVDDVVAYRFSAEYILICVNASNRAKDFAWMTERARGVKPVDRSDDFAQIAVQGPKALDLVQALADRDLSGVGTYRFAEGAVAGVPCIASRTGYTGEDGFELYCPAAQAEKLWFALMEKGNAFGVQACGLGARDSLRTEMKYPLYGNDIDDDHSPLEAGLGWIVKWDKPNFVGKDALLAQKAAGVARKWVGFEMRDAGIARGHHGLWLGGQAVGEVTSGTMSPTLKKAIGMGYVRSELAAEGTEIFVDLRGRKAAARIVKTPFYKKG